MENNNLRNSRSKSRTEQNKTDSVTDIYYGRCTESSQLWDKFSKTFKKNNIFAVYPTSVKIFKDTVGSNQSFFKRENLDNNAIKPVTDNLIFSHADDVGIAMGIELPPFSDSNDSFVVTVELEPLKNAQSQMDLAQNKVTMQLLEKTHSKSIFTGSMRLPLNTDIKKLGQIPLYVVDSNERIISHPRPQLSYLSSIKSTDGVLYSPESELKIKFQLEKITSYRCCLHPKKFSSNDCKCGSLGPCSKRQQPESESSTSNESSDLSEQEPKRRRSVSIILPSDASNSSSSESRSDIRATASQTFPSPKTLPLQSILSKRTSDVKEDKETQALMAEAAATRAPSKVTSESKLSQIPSQTVLSTGQPVMTKKSTSNLKVTKSSEPPEPSEKPEEIRLDADSKVLSRSKSSKILSPISLCGTQKSSSAHSVASKTQSKISAKLKESLISQSSPVSQNLQQPQLSPNLQDARVSQMLQKSQISQNQEPQVPPMNQKSQVSQNFQDPRVSQMLEISQLFQNQGPRVSQMIQKPHISQNLQDPRVSQMNPIYQNLQDSRVSEMFQQPQLSQNLQEPLVSQMSQQSHLSQSLQVPRGSQMLQQSQLSQNLKYPAVSQMIQQPQLSQNFQDPRVSQMLQKSQMSQNQDSRVSQIIQQPQLSQNLQNPQVSEMLQQPQLSQNLLDPRFSQMIQKSQIFQNQDPQVSQMMQQPHQLSQNLQDPRVSQMLQKPKIFQNQDPRVSQMMQQPQRSQNLQNKKYSNVYINNNGCKEVCEGNFLGQNLCSCASCGYPPCQLHLEGPRQSEPGQKKSVDSSSRNSLIRSLGCCFSKNPSNKKDENQQSKFQPSSNSIIKSDDVQNFPSQLSGNNFEQTGTIYGNQYLAQPSGNNFEQTGSIYGNQNLVQPEANNYEATGSIYSNHQSLSKSPGINFNESSLCNSAGGSSLERCDCCFQNLSPELAKLLKMPRNSLQPNNSTQYSTLFESLLKRDAAFVPHTNTQNDSTQYSESHFVKPSNVNTQNASTQYMNYGVSNKGIDVQYSLCKSSDFYHDLFSSDSSVIMPIKPCNEEMEYLSGECLTSDNYSISSNPSHHYVVKSQIQKVMVMQACNNTNLKGGCLKRTDALDGRQVVTNENNWSKHNHSEGKMGEIEKLQLNTDLEAAKKAQRKLEEYIGRTHLSHNQTFTDNELIDVCKILQTESITKEVSLRKKSVGKLIKNKITTCWGFLDANFYNCNEPYSFPLTEYQFYLISDPENSTKVKSWESIAKEIFPTIIEGISNANQTFSELQLVYDELNTMFDKLELPMPILPQDRQYCETVENLEGNLNGTIANLLSSLDIVEVILTSAEPIETFYKSLPKNQEPAETKLEDESNQTRNLLKNEEHKIGFSDDVIKMYSAVEDDIKNIIKELLKETEEIKNAAILNGAQEEVEAPVLCEYMNLITKPNSLPTCKYIVNDHINNSSTSSTPLNTRSRGDEHDNAMNSTKHIFDMIIKEIENNKIILRPCRFDKPFCDAKSLKSKLLVSDIDTGRSCGGSCTLIEDQESTSKKREGKSKAEYKNRITYFCNNLSCKIPKTSFSFGSNSRQKVREHARANLKIQAKRRIVTEEIISGDTMNPAHEIGNKIRSQEINLDALQLCVEPNLNVCSCTIAENNLKKLEDVGGYNNSNTTLDLPSPRESTSRQLSINSMEIPSTDREVIVSEFVLFGDPEPQPSTSKENNQVKPIGQRSSNSSISNSSTSSKISKSQKCFRITGSYDNDMKENSSKLLQEYPRNEHDEEEVISEYDLTYDDPATDIYFGTEILINIQSLSKAQAGYGQSTSSKNPDDDKNEKKLEVVSVKLTNDSMLSESYSDNRPEALSFIYEDDGSSSSSMSHYVLKNTYGKINIAEEPKKENDEDLNSLELEIATQNSESSSSSSKNEVKSNETEISGLSQMQLNLSGVTQYRSKHELNSPEEIAFIEENVRINDLLERRNLSSSEISIESQIYSDAEDSNASTPKSYEKTTPRLT